MQIKHHLTKLLALSALTCGLTAGGDELYTVSSSDDVLRIVDPATAQTKSSITMTVAGRTVQQCNGLSRHPITGDMWVILRLSGANGRSLGRVDLTTGVVTVVGDTGTNISTISFDDLGTLYAVSGDGASPAETMYTLDLTTAAPTLFLTLGNGIDGESIGFHPTTRQFLHASGFGNRGTDQILEYIDPVTKSITNVPITGDTYREGLAITNYTGNNFLIADLNGDLLVLSENGVASFIGVLDHIPKGLVFVPGTTGSWSRAYGTGCVGTGNNIPTLFGSADPAPNSNASLTVVNGVGGASGFVALGIFNTTVPFYPGCDIQIFPLSGILVPINLAGSGPGNGSATFPFTIPAGISGDVYWQVAVADAGNPVLSNPVWMHVQ